MRRFPLCVAVSGFALALPQVARANQPALPPPDPEPSAGAEPSPGSGAAPPTLPPEDAEQPPGTGGQAGAGAQAGAGGQAGPGANPNLKDPFMPASAQDSEPPPGAGEDTAPFDGGDAASDAGPGMVRGLPEPTMSSMRGGVGLFHTTLADVGGPLTFRFRLGTSFFRKKGFIYDNQDPAFGPDQHSRVMGGVNLGFTPWKYLELFFSINSQANRNVRKQPPGMPRQDAETMFALGDLDFGIKGVYPFKDGGVGLGGQFAMGLLSGTQRLSTQALNIWFDVLLSVDLRYLTRKHAPVRITTNVGWMRDQSLNLVDWENITDPTSREVSRFALGANHDRVRMRYALDFPIRLGKEKQFGIDPILEWSWDVATEKDNRFAQPMAQSSPLARSSQWLTIGLRSNVVSGLHLDAAVDVGLVSPNFEYGPPVPPWQLILGLGWSFDMHRPKAPEPEVAAVEEPVGPPPTLEGRVVGQVLAQDGSPVAGAILRFPGLTTNGIVTGAGGEFTTFRFPAGTVAIQVFLPGKDDAPAWEGSAEVRDGDDTSLNIQLEGPAAPATGIVQGAFTAPDGSGIPVTLHVTGQGVDEPFQSTPDGRIALELFEGEYKAVARAEGYLDKELTFTVQPGGEIEVAAQLDPATAPETPNVRASKTRIRLRRKIRYKGTELNPASHPVLDELATFLKYHPEYVLIEIGVHTDDRGNPSKRSKARAEAVKAYLVGKGISPDRIQARGYGDTKPVAVNMTASGRAKNNRTEIRVRKHVAP